jgi:threonine/homoserine/homoserine lactone efflux protein
LYFFQSNTSEVLLAMTFGKKISGIAFNSATFAGSAVLLWEGWKAALSTFKAKNGGS